MQPTRNKMYLIIQERNAEIAELNKVIRSLEDKATKAKEAKNSRSV